MHTLGEAKAALIAWAVSHPNYPGQMPFPDRNDDPSGYDGKVIAILQYQHLVINFCLVNCRFTGKQIHV